MAPPQDFVRGFFMRAILSLKSFETMRYVFIILICVNASCKQQPPKSNSTGTSSNNATSEIPDKTMSDSAKQVLIDISSTAWLQVKAAEVALKKLHDTSL